MSLVDAKNIGLFSGEELEKKEIVEKIKIRIKKNCLPFVPINSSVFSQKNISMQTIMNSLHKIHKL